MIEEKSASWALHEATNQLLNTNGYAHHVLFGLALFSRSPIMFSLSLANIAMGAVHRNSWESEWKKEYPYEQEWRGYIKKADEALDAIGVKITVAPLSLCAVKKDFALLTDALTKRNSR